MTAEDHLKNASNELQRAAEAVKNDVHQLRNDLADIKQANNLQLARLTDELNLVRQQQFQPTEPQQQQQVKTRMSELQRQISDKQRELNDEMKRMSELIRQKEKDITSLIGQARLVAPF